MNGLEFNFPIHPFAESNCFLQKMINYIRSSLSFVQNKIGMYQFYGSPKEICL